MSTSPSKGIQSSDQSWPTLREIGREISAQLEAIQENDMHWVGVVGEDSVQLEGKLRWSQGLADSMLQISVTQGHSEGMLLYVHAAADRYKPAELVPLFRVKLLCGPAPAFRAAEQLYRFVHSGEFEQLTAQRREAADADASDHELERPRERTAQ